MSSRVASVGRPADARLRVACIGLWVSGALLILAALIIVLSVRSVPSSSGATAGVVDATTAQILWSLQDLVLPSISVGLAAVVLPAFLYALRRPEEPDKANRQSVSD